MTSIPHSALARTLVDAGVLIPTSVDGLHMHGARFTAVADAVANVLHTLLGDRVERMRFASVMPRADLERIGYFRNFPHLLGTVHCFCGNEAEHRNLLRAHDAREDWTGMQAATDLVLIPAACYPLYQILAARGPVPEQGYTVHTDANCFRREPSLDPVRVQTFHMFEQIRVGRADQVTAFHDKWKARALQLLSSWGLPADLAPADDPFFGRAAVVMAKSQRDQALKFEVRVAVSDPDRPTPCGSINYHLDSFGTSLGMQLPDGTPAHSACVGFGIERVTLALFRQHGLLLAEWPGDARPDRRRLRGGCLTTPPHARRIHRGES